MSFNGGYTTGNISITGNSSTTDNTFTYWPINGGQQWWETTTITTTGTGNSVAPAPKLISNPAPVIPDFQESEVGRLRRSVEDLCTEGRLALAA